MKAFTVLRAAAFRALKPQLFDTLMPLEVIEGVKAKYNFSKFPEKPDAPLDFQLGKLPRGKGGAAIKIEQFLIVFIPNRATSLGAATRTSTNDAEVFLEDLIEWAEKEFGLDGNQVAAPTYYSQAEFILERPLNSGFREIQPIGDAITNLIRGYGLKDCPAFECGGFTMHFDTNEPTLKVTPVPFGIERRLGARYTENKYFSQAPLRTDDHKAVLEQLEKILLGPDEFGRERGRA